MIFVICGLIVCCTTYIGFGLSDYYIKREKFFYEISQFCERLKADISFLLMPIGEILINAGNEYSALMSGIIKNCQNLLNLGKPLTRDLLYLSFDTKLLNDEEKRLVCDFFSMLGKSDEKTQIDGIENYHKRFLTAENCITQERKKYSPLFKKLGFLCGLAICLFML